MRSKTHEVWLIGQHGKCLDLAAVGEAVARMAVQLLGDVAGLHREYGHARGRDAANSAAIASDGMLRSRQLRMSSYLAPCVAVEAQVSVTTRM